MMRFATVVLTILFLSISQKASCQKTFDFPFNERETSFVNSSKAEDITAPNNGDWKNKKSAVVLTYDDALNVHLDHALPILDSLGLKATFYISGYSGAIHTRLAEWRAAAHKGHELGNHTLFHPCNGQLPGREFVKKDYDLSTYSISRVEDEIKMTNTLLASLDGKTKRTFAYPCSDTKIGDTYYLKNLESAFTGARAVYTEMPLVGEAQLYNLGSVMVSGQTGDQLIDMVKKATVKGALLVFLFHGVGGEHNLDVSLEAHRKLLHYLKQHESEIWVAPMTEVAEHIKAQQGKATK